MLSDAGRVLQNRMRNIAVGNSPEVRLNMSESVQVARSARLRTCSDGGTLPATKRLPANNGARDRAVDVHVSGVDVVQPVGDLRRIERVNSCGQAELDRVLPFNRLLEGVGSHDAEDRTEVLGQVILGARLHAGANTGGPQLVAELTGLHNPRLAGLKLGETPQELALGLFGYRPHFR